ncbi:tetraspanin [Rhizodiscina lignyota]|uniref:Tetraspanin n=1 Tax=Rhizodiscina lignyota TaxID=1504668 RepID=A0A9P4IDQ7_9PEZI|nr:tetraspanin [Rhizodiscina lignyota]
MAINKLMLSYGGIALLFAMTGGLLMGFSVMSENLNKATPTMNNVATNLLLGQCPLTAGIANAVIVFFTFLMTIPVIILPSNKSFLRIQGWFVTLCAVFTLILGLVIWFDTLATRANLSHVWAQQDATRQGLLQQKFNCCGYMNATSPPFVQDATCPNALTAVQKQGCVAPFTKFANGYLDLIFTAAFGIVGVDVFLLLTVVMVVKRRGELERYRHIDEKNGNGFGI